MSEDAFLPALAAFVRRTPFRPFLIEMMSGHQFPVRHPEAVAVGEHAIVYRDTNGGFQIFGHSGVCRIFDSEAARARPGG